MKLNTHGHEEFIDVVEAARPENYKVHKQDAKNEPKHRGMKGCVQHLQPLTS